MDSFGGCCFSCRRNINPKLPMNQKILYSFPTRTRPSKFFSCMDAIKRLSASDNYQVLIKADEDDLTMNNADVWNRTSHEHYGKYLFAWGRSNNKIHAVNRDIDKVDPNWNIIVSMSDDMKLEVPGFDNIIRADIAEAFPDGDGFIHYNDGFQKSNVSTLSIMTRKYYGRTGYIYHPDYTSLWSDVEATEVAWMLGRYKYMGNDKILFRHMHPVWKMAEMDEQYRKSETPELFERDKAIILQRRAINYGLAPEEIKNGLKYAKL
jgi:hypothetical protein